MILEVIGFIALSIIGLFLGLYVSLFFIVGGLIGDNIGGRPATLGEKIVMILFIIVTILLWYWIYHICPFTISYKIN